jgi:hypothetical protein
MKIYERIEFQITDEGLELISQVSHDYDGPIAKCKGDGTAKDQLREQNALQREAFNLMKQRQADVQGAVGKYLSGNEGFDPQQLALMRSQLLNQLSSNYNQAGKNVMTALARRGSVQAGAPVGGDYVRGVASLEGGLASDRSSGLANIDLSNLQQALNNKFNAASLINGQAATLTSPIGTFGAGANNALNQYVYASNQGFGNAFTSAFGSTLGKGLGAGLTGAIGAGLPGSFGQGFGGK